MGKRKSSINQSSAEKRKRSLPAKCVKADPIEDACTSLLGFFRETDSVPSSLAAPLAAMLPMVLSTLTEDRHELEQTFAEHIGKVLEVCVADIDHKVATTTEALSAAQANEAAMAATAELSSQALTLAEAAVASTRSNLTAATETVAAAGKAVVNQQMEVLQLGKTKEKLEREAAELTGGLELLLPEASPAAKDAKKLVTLLHQVGSTASLCNAIPSALGATEGFGLMAVNEAQTLLRAKHEEVTGRLDAWGEHCHSMQVKSDELAGAQQVATEHLSAMQDAVSAAEASQKVAKTAKKDSNSMLSAATEEVTSKTVDSDAAGEEKGKATASQNRYEMLLTRTEKGENEPAVMEEASEEVKPKLGRMSDATTEAGTPKPGRMSGESQLTESAELDAVPAEEKELEPIKMDELPAEVTEQEPAEMDAVPAEKELEPAEMDEMPAQVTELEPAKMEQQPAGESEQEPAEPNMVEGDAAVTEVTVEATVVDDTYRLVRSCSDARSVPESPAEDMPFAVAGHSEEFGS